MTDGQQSYPEADFSALVPSKDPFVGARDAVRAVITWYQMRIDIETASPRPDRQAIEEWESGRKQAQTDRNALKSATEQMAVAMDQRYTEALRSLRAQ